MIASCEPVKVINSQNYEAEFSCIGFDYESLLINFLSEALYLSAVNKVVYERVVFTNFSLEKASGVLGGYAISKFNNSEIKAVTHHGVNIQRVNNILQTTILFDV
jgi:SHS2 domain-containing protein